MKIAPSRRLISLREKQRWLFAQRHPERSSIEICSPGICSTGRGWKVSSSVSSPRSSSFPSDRRQDRSSEIKFPGESISRMVAKKRKRKKRKERKKKKKGRKKKIEESFTWATKIRAYCESETELLTRHTFFPPVDVFPTGSAKWSSASDLFFFLFFFKDNTTTGETRAGRVWIKEPGRNPVTKTKAEMHWKSRMEDTGGAEAKRAMKCSLNRLIYSNDKRPWSVE